MVRCIPRKTRGTRRENEKVGWGQRKAGRRREKGETQGRETVERNSWTLDGMLTWMHVGARRVVFLLVPCTNWNVQGQQRIMDGQEGQ